MKSLPTSKPEPERRPRDEQRHQRDEPRVAQAPVEDRRVARLDPPQQRHILVAAGLERAAGMKPAAIGTTVTASTSEAAIAAITAAASG